jgi:hypothetical protein
LSFFLLGGAMAISLPIFFAARSISADAAWFCVATGVVMSYPFLFALDRGNNITIAVGLCLVAMSLEHRGKHSVAAVLIGLAAAIKIYPILFLLIFSHRRRWRYLAMGTVSAGAISLLSFSTFRGGIEENLRTLLANLQSTGNTGAQIDLNHSMNGLVGAIQNSISWFPVVDSRLTGIIVIGTAIFIFLVSNVVRQREILPEILALACVLQTLFVALTYGYTLLVYLVVLQMILLSRRTDWWCKTYVVLLAILFASKGIPVGTPPRQLLNYVNPVVELLIFFTALVSISIRSFSRTSDQPAEIAIESRRVIEL